MFIKPYYYLFFVTKTMFIPEILSIVIPYCDPVTSISLASTCNDIREFIINEMNDYWRQVIVDITLGLYGSDEHDNNCRCNELNENYYTFNGKKIPDYYRNKVDKMFITENYEKWYYFLTDIIRTFPNKMKISSDGSYKFKTDPDIYHNLSHIKKLLIHKIAMMTLICSEFGKLNQTNFFDEIEIHFGNTHFFRIKWISFCILIYTQTFELMVHSIIERFYGAVFFFLGDFSYYSDKVFYNNYLEIETSMDVLFSHSEFAHSFKPSSLIPIKYNIINEDCDFDLNYCEEKYLYDGKIKADQMSFNELRYDNIKILNINHCQINKMKVDITRYKRSPQYIHRKLSLRASTNISNMCIKDEIEKNYDCVEWMHRCGLDLDLMTKCISYIDKDSSNIKIYIN